MGGGGEKGSPGEGWRRGWGIPHNTYRCKQSPVLQLRNSGGDNCLRWQRPLRPHADGPSPHAPDMLMFVRVTAWT